MEGGAVVSRIVGPRTVKLRAASIIRGCNHLDGNLTRGACEECIATGLAFLLDEIQAVIDSAFQTK